MNTRLIIISLVMLACIAGVVSAVNSGDDVGHAVLYENKYVDNNPMLTFPDPATYGYVIAYVRAGGSAQDLTVWVINDVANQTFDSYFHFDQTPVVGQNPMFEKLEVLPDGVSKPKSFPAGSYTAYLQRGNGDQLETVHFKIGGGATERITFLGAAVSSKHITEPTLKIVEAKYGMGQTCTPTWVEEVNHTEYRYWIAGSPAKDTWTEHFGDYNQVTIPATYKEVIDVPAHDEYRTYDTYQITDHKWFWENSHLVEKVKCTNHAEHGNGWHIETAGCTAKYNFGDWSDHKPHSGSYETRHVDATYKTVVDVPEHYNYVNVGTNNGDWEKVTYCTSHTHHCETVYNYIKPVEHEAIPEGQGYWSEWSRTQDGGDVTYETRIVVDEPAHAGEPVCDGGNYIDVTTIVQNLVSGGQLHIAADYPNQHYNALFTDPCPGIFKELVVKYQINGGAVQTKTVAEDVDISIP